MGTTMEAAQKNLNISGARPLQPVSVSVSYWLDGASEAGPPTESQTWDETIVPPARIGLPPDTLPTKPEPGDYTYSGMHDQGPLPQPREGGPMASLIACVQRAKQSNDEFLTRIIEAEKAAKEQHKDKRAKITGE